MPVEPSWRKGVGIFLIVMLIVGWSVAVVTLAERLGEWPWPLQALFFIVAGIAWIAPLKPLLRWMEVGKWRE